MAHEDGRLSRRMKFHPGRPLVLGDGGGDIVLMRSTASANGVRVNDELFVQGTSAEIDAQVEAGFMEYVGGGGPAKRPISAKPAPAPEVEEPAVEVEPELEDDNDDDSFDAVEFLDRNAKDVIADVDVLGDDERAAAVEAEESGKARKTVLAALRGE